MCRTTRLDLDVGLTGADDGAANVAARSLAPRSQAEDPVMLLALGMGAWLVQR